MHALILHVLMAFVAKPHDRIVCNVIAMKYAEDIVTATIRIRATGLSSEVIVSRTHLANLIRKTHFMDATYRVAVIDNNTYQYSDDRYVAIKPGTEATVTVTVECEDGPKYIPKRLTALRMANVELKYALFCDIVVLRTGGEQRIIKALGSGNVPYTTK